MLEYLDLKENSLTGKIPTEIGLLTALTGLDFEDNDLTGNFPSEIGLLSTLIDLDLF